MAGQGKSDSPALEIQFVKGVGPKRAALLKSRLNITTVADVLYYLPFRYEDRGNLVSMRDLKPEQMQTVSGKVVAADVIDLKNHGRKITDPRRFRPVKGLLFELTLADGTTINLREIELVASNGKERLVWYWYNIGGRLTVNKYEAKAMQLTGLLIGQPRAYMVAVSVPVKDDVEQSREFIQKLVNDLKKPLANLQVRNSR